MKDNILLEVKNLVKDFSGDRVVDDISFKVKENEFLTILGPSGCGKTTILRIIGGFENPTEGQVFLDGKDITKLHPHKREVNTVFQKYALFPHLDVFENVAFGLKIKKLPAKEIKQRVKDMLELVDLKGFEKRSVSKLSGGQQQRVAIARALVNYPKLLLLDEPLGALDLKLRKDMQIELKKIQKNLKITFIYVTHDQEEALSMSDNVIVMKDGKIEQFGEPQDIYNDPDNAFVADFIGESNIFNAKVLDYKLLDICGSKFEITEDDFPIGSNIDVVIRPEDIVVVPLESAQISGVVDAIVFKGIYYEMTVNCDGFFWLIQSTKASEVGEKVGLMLDPFDIHCMKKMFQDSVNRLKGVVSDENTVFIGDYALSFSFENLNIAVDSEVEVIINPFDIDLIEDKEGDIEGYLDSIIYKGKYNELLVVTEKGRFLIYSNRDEQVGTDVGLKIDFSKAEINLLKEDYESKKN